MNKLRLLVSAMAVVLLSLVGSNAFAQIDVTKAAYGSAGDGWLRDNSGGNWGTSPYGSKGDAVKGWEQWQGQPGKLNNRIMYKVAELPAGTYTVKARVNAVQQAGDDTSTKEVFFYAADQQVNCYGGWTDRELTFTIDKVQPVEIGVRTSAEGVVNWVAIEDLAVTTSSFSDISAIEKLATDKILASGVIPTNSLNGWSISSKGEGENLQVNTWSTEGATDGSNMLIPFIENWHNRGTMLTDKTITYTLKSLDSGWYEIGCLLRCLEETGNNAPDGVYLSLNSDVYSATDGATPCTNGCFKNLVKPVYVGEDGVLTIGIVIQNATVNWVNWRDVTIKKVASLSPAIAGYNKGETACAVSVKPVAGGTIYYSLDGFEQDVTILDGEKTINVSPTVTDEASVVKVSFREYDEKENLLAAGYIEVPFKATSLKLDAVYSLDKTMCTINVNPIHGGTLYYSIAEKFEDEAMLVEGPIVLAYTGKEETFTYNLIVREYDDDMNVLVEASMPVTLSMPIEEGAIPGSLPEYPIVLSNEWNKITAASVGKDDVYTYFKYVADKDGDFVFSVNPGKTTLINAEGFTVTEVKGVKGTAYTKPVKAGDVIVLKTVLPIVADGRKIISFNVYAAVRNLEAEKALELNTVYNETNTMCTVTVEPAFGGMLFYSIAEKFEDEAMLVEGPIMLAYTGTEDTFTYNLIVREYNEDMTEILAEVTETIVLSKPVEDVEPVVPEKPVPAFSPLTADGETVVYLYNVEAGAFVLGANEWNTRASLSVEKGYQFKVIDNGDGTYKLNNYVETKSNWFDMFADGPAAIYVDRNAQPNVNWTITPADAANTYTIGNTGVEGKFGTDKDIATDSRIYLIESGSTTWAFVSEAAYAKYLEDAAEYFNYLKIATAKDQIEKMLGELEATNVYSQEAYDTFMEKYPLNDWLAACKDGSVDVEAVNSAYKGNFAVTGWHAANDIDDLLTSLWDGADGNFGGQYYINTWSVEGESDGSDFRVPFFEYWTGDDSSLGAKTMTATVPGLEPNAEYSVSSWTRTRIKNGAEAPVYGISFKVGDGEATNACIGEQVGTSPMYLATVTAKGKADAEGNLTISYIVAEDNNISWLSWKNTKYEMVLPAVEDGTYYVMNNESGQYLSNGAFWGTRATLSYDGITYAVTRNIENGKYTLTSNVKGEGKALRPSDGFNDQSGEWEIIETEGGVQLFNGTQYFSFDGTNIPQFVDQPTAASVWSFVTPEQRAAKLAEALATATPENPVEASYFIKHGDFVPNDPRTDAAWEGGLKIGFDGGSGCSVPNSGNSEKWNAGAFDVNQTLTGLPAGSYKLTVFSFYRNGGANPAAAAAYEGGTEVSPIIYAGDKSMPVKSVFSGAKTEKVAGWSTEVTAESGKVYYIPNSQGDADHCFTEDAYLHTIEGITVGEDGTLKIGVSREGEAIEDWTVYDQFRLYYLGEVAEPENLLANGDAEGEYGESICAYGKEDKGAPHAADIEEIAGNKTFVVHATAKSENPWDNQFWINAPRTFSEGDVFTISFIYKASKDASVGTQAHRAPSEYLHYMAIGNVDFTTEWKQFYKVVTVDASMSGMQSIAFNLNDFADANDYYVDNIVWIMGEQPEPEPNFPSEVESTDLTAEMFCRWDGFGADANVVSTNAGEYHIGESTGLPYGHGNVEGSAFADLTQWSTLALTVTEGAPRLLLNRQGMDNSGDFIEINNPESPYVVVVGDVWYINLEKIVAEAGYAHLNCIKGANWANATITEAVLYTGGFNATGIETVQPAPVVKPAGIYTINGVKVNTLQKGLNIVIDENGVAKKVLVK